MHETILSLLVTNQFGVLTKVSTLFSRRGINIHSLTVGPTQLPDYSRITVTVHQTSDKLRQIYTQLDKLEDVKEVTLIAGDAHIERAFALIKLRKDSAACDDLEDTGLYVKTHSMEDRSTMVEALGPTARVDAFIERLRPYGIDLLTRSGCTAI